MYRPCALVEEVPRVDVRRRPADGRARPTARIVLTIGKLCSEARAVRDRQPEPDDVGSRRALSSRVTPSTRRRYSAIHDGLPNGPTACRRARRPCSRARRRRRTRARRPSDAARDRRRLDAREPVVEIRAREARREPALDARRRRSRRRRARARRPGTCASESPATQTRSGCAAVKTGFGVGVACGCGVRGSGRRRSRGRRQRSGAPASRSGPRSRARSRPAARGAASSGAACG